MANRGYSNSNKLNPQLIKLMNKFKEVIYEKPFNFIHDKTLSQWQIFENYVEHNKKWMRFCEDALTKISFFLPGRWGNGNGEIGEFVYAMGLVLQILNDRALNEESNASIWCGKEKESESTTQNMKSFVQLLQCMQLFIELMAIKHLSSQTRWRLILLIECIKMMCRLYLLRVFNGHMLILQNEQETKFNERLRQTQTENNQNKFCDLQKLYVEHGRGSDPNGFWSPLSQKKQKLVDNSQLSAHATLNRVKYPRNNGIALKRAIIAELLYIARPVVYVCTFLRFGQNESAWTPFAVSLFMDIFSHILHFSNSIVTVRQKTELYRRRKFWIFYLLRPPFFNAFIEKYLKQKGKRLKNKNANVRYWILMMITNLICQFQGNYFNISASNY